jgi:2-polyprenyl-3-methyl-5-hydroxy-6-metoxy-1,4-benzoquinol methylase
MPSDIEKQREHFEQTAAQYDYECIINPPPHIQEEIRLILESIRQNAPEASEIIDFGSGTGRLSIPLLQNGYKVHAIDISQNSLQRLHELASEVGRGDALSSANQLPTVGSYALIVGTDVLHHVDIPAAVKQFSANLSPNGACIFSEPNVLNLSWSVFITLSRKTCWSVESGILFCNYFTLRSYFRRAGFQVKIVGLALLPPQLFTWSKALSRLNYWLGNLPVLKVFAFRLVVVATRAG